MTRLLLPLALLLLLPLATAQTVIEFWHSQDTAVDLIQDFADEFNAGQDRYRVQPRYVGSYQEGAIKLVAALRGQSPPALFDAELTVYQRLLEEEALADLADLGAQLPPERVADYVPTLWNYGLDGERRYGLPWDMSLPVLVYNASVMRQRGLEPPTDWEAFEEVARRLTTRNTRGYIDVAAAFIFEALVTTRGGSLVTADGRPNFDSPEALDALTMLQRLARDGDSIPRSFAELDQALVDFARGKGMMAIASHAFFPQGERFSVTFEVGAAPLPGVVGHTVPLTGAQLVVPRAASDAQRRGAFDFWRYLTEEDPLRRWVQASYALPVRRSTAEALEPWYRETPSRAASLDELAYARERPRVGAYALWQQFLEEAIERVTKGGADPASALREAQERALSGP